MDIRKYQCINGKVPFDIWMAKLKERRAKAKILIRLKRMETGHFGDVKSLGDGLHECRITEGQAYRVYFGLHANNLVLLLCAGNKATQSKDIQRARQYWSDYNAE